MISLYLGGADALDQPVDKDRPVCGSPIIDDVRSFAGLLLLFDIEMSALC